MIVGWKDCIESSAILLRTVPLDHRDTTGLPCLRSLLAPVFFLLCWFPLLSRAFGSVSVASGQRLLDVVFGEL